jgi:hypothetical protein
MMKPWIPFLGGLLLAQLVLALGLNLSGDDYSAFEPKEPLLAFDPAAVDRLVLADADASLTLSKQGADWELPDAGGFPADAAGVRRLIERLAALEKGWPVATSSSAARRFEVADDSYQRKLALYSGDQPMGQLYVGTSPGFRKVHARPGDEERVFSVELNTWELSPRTDDWIDKGILALDAADLTRVRMPGFTLQRDGDAWRLEDSSEGESPNPEAVERLLRQIAGLRIDSLAGTGPEPDQAESQPLLEMEVRLRNGETLSYRFSRAEEEEGPFVLKRSDQAYLVELPGYAVEPLLETTRDGLVESQQEPAPAADF